MGRLAKRSRKFLGTRNCGKGNAKNGRGKGNKGGWGRAGMHKHRFSYINVYEPEFFGVHGFAGVRTKIVKTINLYEIEQLAMNGKLEKREGKSYFEFKGKVLGCGVFISPVNIKAAAFSEKAMEKIKAAGGNAETFAPAVPE